MKTYIVALGILALFAVPHVYAESSTRVATRTAVRQETAMSRLKTRADNEITRRVNALTKLTTVISNIKRLTDAQKTTLATDIQSQITALTTLKTKIDADTDLDTLRADVKSIVDSYRIFALYIPKTYIIVHADRLLDIVDDMTALETKLKERGGAQSQLDLMTAKLTDAKTQATNALTAVIALTPDGYPANKATLKSARTMLVTARQDIQEAHKIGQQIRQSLHATPTP